MLADIHLTDVEGVSPVVVGDTPVITTDGAEPPGNIKYLELLSPDSVECRYLHNVK